MQSVNPKGFNRDPILLYSSLDLLIRSNSSGLILFIAVFICLILSCFYCAGKMEDYRSFIDNIDSIRERYRKRKNESLGIYETRSQKQHPQNRSDTVLHKKKKDI